MAKVDLPDDLLRPTLSEQDDVSGFDEPWNPYNILYPTFFGGFLAGGVLYGLNFTKLGQDRYRIPTFIGTAVAVLGVAILGNWLAATGKIAGDDRMSLSIFRFGQRFASLALGWLLATRQTRRFRLYEESGLKARKLLWPGLIMVGLGTIAQLVLWGMIRVLFFKS